MLLARNNMLKMIGCPMDDRELLELESF